MPSPTMHHTVTCSWLERARYANPLALQVLRIPVPLLDHPRKGTTVHQ